MLRNLRVAARGRDARAACCLRSRPGRRRAPAATARPCPRDLVTAPGVEELAGRLEKGPRPGVAGVLRQEAAAAEVLAGERIPRRDDVPPGPAVRQVIQAGELPGHLVRLVEGRVNGAGQAEPVGHRRESGQDGKSVGPPDHVEVIDLAVLLAQPQALGEKQKVELGPLGGLGQMRERAELDMAARAGVAPHRGVVHGGEMGSEVNLLDGLRHDRVLRSRRSGGGVAAGGTAEAE